MPIELVGCWYDRKLVQLLDCSVYWLVFTGSADGTVKSWRRELVGNRAKHVLVETLLKQDNAVTSLAVNTTAAMVYAGSSDGLVNFWERQKHFLEYGGALRGHKLAVLCVAVAGNLVLSGSADKSICVWRRDEGGIHSCLTVLTGPNGPVKCLIVEEDSDDSDRGSEDEEAPAAEMRSDKYWRVYSGSLDNSVKVWRLLELFWAEEHNPRNLPHVYEERPLRYFR